MFADLVVAVNVGVILAVLHFLRRMAESVETQALDASTIESELARQGIDALPADTKFPILHSVFEIGFADIGV